MWLILAPLRSTSFPIEKVPSCEVCVCPGGAEKFPSLNLLISISFQFFPFDGQIKGVEIITEFATLEGCVWQTLILSLSWQLGSFRGVTWIGFNNYCTKLEIWASLGSLCSPMDCEGLILHYHVVIQPPLLQGLSAFVINFCFRELIAWL